MANSTETTTTSATTNKTSTPSNPHLATPTPAPKRYAQIIRLHPQHAPEYIRLHASVWPSVLARISASNIHDYSIFYDEPLGLLFASFKYTGVDFEGDMRRMSEDEETRRWWGITDGMQESLNVGASGSEQGGWWREVREVFYTP